MDWYRSFFGPDYLRVFGPYVEGDRARDEAMGAARLLDLPTGGAVLDLACGQGRHAVPLAAAGLAVTGLDLSPELLSAARVRSEVLPLVRADMRSLPFADASFDAVLNLFNAFGYFDSDEEDLAVLRHVSRVLRPGGMFVQEVHHRDALVLGWEPRTVHSAYADGLILSEDREWDAVRGRHRVVYTLTEPDSPPRTIAHTLRVYTLTEVVALHERAGLTVTSVTGDFDGAQPSPRTPLAVIVSRR